MASADARYPPTTFGRKPIDDTPKADFSPLHSAKIQLRCGWKTRRICLLLSLPVQLTLSIARRRAQPL